MRSYINRRRRSGIAMVVVLAAIVIIGALVAGAFAASTQEYRIGRNAVIQERALEAAEMGQYSMLENWNPTIHARLKTGDTLRRTFNYLYNTRASVEMTKLNNTTYWIVSEGISGRNVANEARRRTGLVMRLEIPEIKALGALTARGTTKVSGSVRIDGNDSIPTGWGDCPEDKTNKPGIVNKDPSYRTTSGAVTVFGNPAVADDNRAGDTTTYFNYGNTNYQKMTAAATKVYTVPTGGSYVLNGVGPSLNLALDCAFAVNTNWGDPSRAIVPGACEDYYPVIWAKGNGTFKVTNGKGQGALFVDGDLEFTGNFQFVGLIIVRGSVKMSGTGNKVTGAVLAAAIEVNDTALLTGNSSIQYSSCAVNTTIAGVGRLELATKRAWADMF